MYVPEMGQMIFGASWGRFECPEFVLHGINTINNKLEDKFGDGFYIENNGNVYYNNDFVIQSYYWGECVCGYEQLESLWEKDESHSEDCFHTAYINFHDTYGSEWSEIAKGLGEERWKETYEDFKSQHGLSQGEDGDHGIAVKCDCGYDTRWEKWVSTHGHAENCFSVRPNLWHIASDTRIYWYKYPGRGMSINKQISDKFWMKIVEECVTSIEDDSRNRADVEDAGKDYFGV